MLENGRGVPGPGQPRSRPVPYTREHSIQQPTASATISSTSAHTLPNSSFCVFCFPTQHTIVVLMLERRSLRRNLNPIRYSSPHIRVPSAVSNWRCSPQARTFNFRASALHVCQWPLNLRVRRSQDRRGTPPPTPPRLTLPVNDSIAASSSLSHTRELW